MAKKVVKHPYEELKRYLMAFTLFCFAVAVVGMVATGSRIITITWAGLLVIVSLQMISRIIIWALSSMDRVKQGAEEKD